MNNLDLLMPNAAPEIDRWTWATVTTASPLAIRLDGDASPLPFEPECLYAHPSVGDRVWVQMNGRRVIVTGVHKGDNTPAGVIQMFVGSVAPVGWMICNGSTVSSTTYPELATALGDKFGTHSGTTYYLPDFRDRFPVGASGTRAVGAAGGSATIATGNLPAHTHSIDHDHGSATSSSNGAHSHTVLRGEDIGGATNRVVQSNTTVPAEGDTSTSTDGAHTHTVDLPNYTGTSGSTGSGTAYWQPFSAINFIIKA